MFSIVIAAIMELFKCLLPPLIRKLNEPTTAKDSSTVPRHIMDAWMRRR